MKRRKTGKDSEKWESMSEGARGQWRQQERVAREVRGMKESETASQWNSEGETDTETVRRDKEEERQRLSPLPQDITHITGKECCALSPSICISMGFY